MKKITVSILTTLLMLSMVFSSSVFAAEKEQSAWDSFLGLFSAKTAATSDVGVEYRGHIQNVGNYPLDGSWIQGPTRLGTVGQSLRLEGFWIKLTNKPADVNIQYQVHVQNVGWMDPVDNGEFAGTEGRSLQIEAIKISLVDDNGNPVKGYSVEYRGHVQNIGDTVWYKDGAQLGTDGQFLRLEALEVKIVKTQTDMTAYNAAVEAAEAVDEADYTADSYAALQKALEDNVVTVNNTQAEVDAATAAINDAIDALVPISETGLTVTTSMAGSASVARGQSLVNVASITLTAKGEDVTVTGLKVNRTGLSADADLASITAWEGATRLNVPSIFSNGTATLGFTSNLVIPANTSKTIDVKTNISAAATVASQIVLSLKDASAITTTAAITGTFPASTGTFTVANVTLGTLTPAAAADSATGNIYPGSTDEQSFAKFRITAANEGVKLTTVTFTQAGTAGDSDLSSLKLYNASGVQVGQTASVSGRKVTFDISSANIVIGNGASTTLELRGIANGGAAGRTVQFGIADTTDLQGIGQTYGTTVIGTATPNANILTAATGALNVALDTTNPSAATIGPNSTSKFTAIKVQAQNEPIQLRTIQLQLATGTVAPNTLSNITLKVGDTVIGQVQNFFTSAVGGATQNATMTLTNPLTVATGQSVVIDVYGTTGAAVAGTYRMGLFSAVDTISGIGTISGNTVTVNSGATGNIMTIGAQTITSNIAANNGVTIFANGINQQVGTLTISHNLPKTVNVSTARVVLNTTNARTAFTNLRLVDANGNVVSNTIGTPNNAGTANVLTFNSTLAVAQGQTVSLKVLADVNSTAIALDSITVTAGNVTGVTADDGETVTPAAGAGSLVATVGATVAAGDVTGAVSVPGLVASNVAAGTTGVEIARATLTNGGGEAIKLNQINLNSVVSNLALVPNVSNYVITDGGGNVLATVASLAGSIAGTDTLIDLSTPLTINAVTNNTQQIKVFADFSSAATGGQTINVTIGNAAAAPAVAYSYTGAATGVAATTSADTAPGTTFTIAASKVSVTSSAVVDSTPTAASIGPGQTLASFTFKNEGTTSVILNQVRINDVLSNNVGNITSANRDLTAVIQLRDADWVVRGSSAALAAATDIDVTMGAGGNIVLAPGESTTLYATLSQNTTSAAIIAGNSSRLQVVSAGTLYTNTTDLVTTYTVNNSVTSASTIIWD